MISNVILVKLYRFELEILLQQKRDEREEFKRKIFEVAQLYLSQKDQ